MLAKVLFESPQVTSFQKFKEERLCWIEISNYVQNAQTATLKS